MIKQGVIGGVIAVGDNWSRSKLRDKIKALTPKFNPIDFTEYSSFKLQAKGTGTLIIRLVKESITDWEQQYKTSIELTESFTDYNIALSEFSSSNGVPFASNDITSIVFTMLAEGGVEETKTMTLEQLRFAKTSLSVKGIEDENAIRRAEEMYSRGSGVTKDPEHGFQRWQGFALGQHTDKEQHAKHCQCRQVGGDALPDEAHNCK